MTIRKIYPPSLPSHRIGHRTSRHFDHLEKPNGYALTGGGITRLINGNGCLVIGANYSVGGQH